MLNQISNLCQVSYVRRYTIDSSKENGVKVIDLLNGNIRVLLNESKALDIMQIFYRGKNISFISKNGFSLRDDDFSKRFEGGMMYTVGLDSAGARDGFPLHGTFHNLKPEIIRCEVNEKEVIVEGLIEDTALFGKNLVLKRKYHLSNNELILEDCLMNKGKVTEKYCLLYHNNIGYPLLDDGDEIHINVSDISPRTPFAKEKQVEWNKITYPVDITDETCYFLKVLDGKASLINSKANMVLTISWNKENLPEFVLWKSMKSQDYALGFEPSTTKLDNDFNYQEIAPEQEIGFMLSYKIEELY